MIPIQIECLSGKLLVSGSSLQEFFLSLGSQVSIQKLLQELVKIAVFPLGFQGVAISTCMGNRGIRFVNQLVTQ